MKTIGEILKNNNTTLAKLIKKTQNTKSLDAVFQSMLDADFAKNCHFASLEGPTLTIVVTNASWATKLRYAIPDMIKNLHTQQEFKAITTIRYRINQPTPYSKSQKKPTKLSHSNEILWKEALARLKKMTKT
jgi:hypothetical protein